MKYFLKSDGLSSKDALEQFRALATSEYFGEYLLKPTHRPVGQIHPLQECINVATTADQQALKTIAPNITQTVSELLENHRLRSSVRLTLDASVAIRTRYGFDHDAPTNITLLMRSYNPLLFEVAGIASESTDAPSTHRAQHQGAYQRWHRALALQATSILIHYSRTSTKRVWIPNILGEPLRMGMHHIGAGVFVEQNTPAEDEEN